MDVKKVSKLARIELTEEECQKLSSQFGDILGYIHKMDELDLKDTDPASHPFDLKNVFREDKKQSSLGAENLMKIAPKSHDNMIEVPRIIPNTPQKSE